MREPENGAVLRASLEVFFSKGSGNFPEFFEKSIDKHKIDAILNSTVRFWGQPFGAVILLDGEPGLSV